MIGLRQSRDEILNVLVGFEDLAIEVIDLGVNTIDLVLETVVADWF